MSATPSSGKGRARGRGGGGGGTHDISRGGGRGGQSSRGRGGGGGGDGGGTGGRRSNFGGRLTTSDAAVDPQASSSSSQKGKAVDKATPEQESSGKDAAAPIDQPATAVPDGEEDDGEEERCFICTEPTQMWAIGECNHPTCHICAVRLRALYKVKECTFCKSPLNSLIISPRSTKKFQEFTGEDLPCSDLKLAFKFESREVMENTLILLRYNCPDERCDVISAGWADMKMHAKRDHDRLLCDLCTKNKKIFTHEHELHTTQSLAAHMNADHRFCEFCHTWFYSDDELYVHMRDKHEQCHICKASGDETERWQYFRDYNMLESHFRQRHYLCMSKDCLEKKFVVFESEMDFKAHQVAEHGAELSSKELKEAMRIEANFHYQNPNATGSSSGAANRGGRRGRQGGRGQAEPDPPTRSDPLALSSLALRANVPGAGPANHSRRIHFGGHTTTSGEASQQQAANALAASNSRSAAGGSSSDKNAVEKHEAYLAKVLEILNGSESKLTSFRSAVRVFRAGEMSANDLVDTIYSLVGDMDSSAVVVNGLVDLLDTDADKKKAVLAAWNKLRIERTQFPSLIPGGRGGGSSTVGLGFPSLAIRTAKPRATSNNQIWANVERAAVRGSGQMVISGKPGTSRDHFPTLGSGTSSKHFNPSSSTASRSSVPGSASHSAKVNANLRAIHGSTPWSQASSTTRVAPPSIPSPPVPYASTSYPTTSASKAANGLGSSSSSSKAPPKATSTQAFPALPLNATASAIAAQKRALFNRRRTGGGGTGGGGGADATTSGSSTPWMTASDGGSRAGERIDSAGSPEERSYSLDIGAVRRRLDDVTMASTTSGSSTPPGASGGGSSGGGGGGGGGQKGKKKKGVAVLSMGGIHRGA